MAKALKGYKENHIPIINRLKSEHSVSLVGSAEFISVTAFRHNRVKWATRAEPDTTKQIAPTSFKQKVIMLNRQFQTEWNSFKQDPKKTAAIFLKCDAGEVRTRGPSVSSQALSHCAPLPYSFSRKKFVNFNKATLLCVTQNPIKPICTVSS